MLSPLAYRLEVFGGAACPALPLSALEVSANYPASFLSPVEGVPDIRVRHCESRKTNRKPRKREVTAKQNIRRSQMDLSHTLGAVFQRQQQKPQQRDGAKAPPATVGGGGLPLGGASKVQQEEPTVPVIRVLPEKLQQRLKGEEQGGGYNTHRRSPTLHSHRVSPYEKKEKVGGSHVAPFSVYSDADEELDTMLRPVSMLDEDAVLISSDSNSLLTGMTGVSTAESPTLASSSFELPTFLSHGRTPPGSVMLSGECIFTWDHGDKENEGWWGKADMSPPPGLTGSLSRKPSLPSEMRLPAAPFRDDGCGGVFTFIFTTPPLSRSVSAARDC
jgi:hypothetical protein